MLTKNLTITDIARMAGVSKTTVSRYLNEKYEFMSPETRERIKAVIDLAGYQPNNIARSLKNQKSMLVGLVVADIESPFSSAVIKSVGDAVQGTGYNIIAANADNDPEKEIRNINSLMGQRVDGLIVNTTTAINPFLIGLANSGMPVVLLDRFVNDYKFDIAFIENRQPMWNAMEHLREEGYGSIAFVSQPYEEVSPRFYRREAFLQRVEEWGENGLAGHTCVVQNRDADGIRDTIRRLLEQSSPKGPPAIIASNGVTLMYLARAIQRMGLRMPVDIGLCGYDEWGWASEMGLVEMVGPGLTTLTASIHLLGEMTVSALFRRMENPRGEKLQQVIPADLMIRGSTRLSTATTII